MKTPLALAAGALALAMLAPNAQAAATDADTAIRALAAQSEATDPHNATRDLGLAAALAADPPRRRGQRATPPRGRSGERGRAGERGRSARQASARYYDGGGVSLQPYAGRGLDAALNPANVAGVRLGVEPAGRTGFRAFYEQTLDGGDDRMQAFGADVLVPVLRADAMSLYGVAGGGYLNPTGENAASGQFFGTVGVGVRYGIAQGLGVSGELGVRVHEGADGSVATTPAFTAGVGLRF